MVCATIEARAIGATNFCWWPAGGSALVRPPGTLGLLRVVLLEVALLLGRRATQSSLEHGRSRPQCWTSFATALFSFTFAFPRTYPPLPTPLFALF